MRPGDRVVYTGVPTRPVMRVVGWNDRTARVQVHRPGDAPGDPVFEHHYHDLRYLGPPGADEGQATA